MEENFLSPELMQECGDMSDVILPSRKKQKRSHECVVSTGETDEEQKLSKRAKKKLEQLKAKYEKEAKRSQYYEILEKNALDDNQRLLLISSRDASNVKSQSAKSRVKRAFHLHKAGVPLSEEENALLFSSKPSSSKRRADMSSLDVGSDEYTKLFQPHASAQNISSATCAVQDDSSENELDRVETPSSTPTAPEGITSAVANPVLTTSVGMSLLQQFQKLKQGKLGHLDQQQGGVRAEDSDAEEEDGGGSSSNQKEPYIPVEMELPLDRFGNVKKRPEAFIESSRPSRASYIVDRDPDIQASRMKLPVCNMEQEIVEAISINDVIILCGETGSGKSTQLPQFMYEAGYGAYGVIGVTQPRRVATVSTSRRVAEEMGVFWKHSRSALAAHKVKGGVANRGDSQVVHDTASRETDILAASSSGGAGELVGYQIRHDASTVGTTTKIKFMTDGILLKEISSDLLLRNYSVIFLDEAHERNVNTDVLIGMISRTIPLRRKQHELELQQWLSIPETERSQYETPIQPLKLVIMSATMRVNDFKNPRLFTVEPPVVKVEARQYPVTTHFSRRTELDDYLRETYRKVCQIHRKLPSGGILVFLTGKREIMHMCRKLSSHLNSRTKLSETLVEELLDNDGDDVSMGSGRFADTSNDMNASSGDLDERENAADMWVDPTQRDMMERFLRDDDFDDGDYDDDDVNDVALGLENEISSASNAIPAEGKEYKRDSIELNNSTGGGAAVNEEDAARAALLKEALGVDAVAVDARQHIRQVDDRENAAGTNSDSSDTPQNSQPTRVLVLPLYAMLSPEQQRRVFEPPPEGHRLIVIATNVAETSITIPGIRYVVDCGRQKERIVDLKSGISTYKVKWISKASADQRKGRAGRTGPGHCYRLYSSAFYDQHMASFQAPEICSTQLEDLILQLRSLGIDNIEKFPFPSPPPLDSLKKAFLVLSYIGALRYHNTAGTGDGNYTTKEENRKLSAVESIDAILNSHESEVEIPQAGLTALGKLIVKFPINVRLAKMLIVAYKTGSLPISLVAGLVACVTERSPFIRLDSKSPGETAESDNDDDGDENVKGNSKKQEIWEHSTSDILARLRALGAFAYAKKQSDDNARKNQKKGKAKLLAQKKKHNKDIRKKKGDYHQVTGAAYGNNESDDFDQEGEVQLDEAVVLCSKLGLQYTTLCRCLELQQQLSSLSRAILSPTKKSTAADISSTLSCELHELPPPDEIQEIALRQIMLTGLSDCVARKAPLGSLEFATGISRRKRLTAYLSCDPAVTTPIYVHPNSALYRKDPSAPLPEYVTYSELITNEREDTTYMAGVTVISSSWIPQLCRDCPLLHWMPFLSNPKPYFDAKADGIMCMVPLTYGIHKWELTPIAQLMSDHVKLMAGDKVVDKFAQHGYGWHDAPYRWYARLLLEGKIVKKDGGLLKIVFKRDKMAESPSALTSMMPNKKASVLLNRITRDNVCTLGDLHRRILVDPLYLSAEIQPFIKAEYRKEFRLAWKAFATVVQKQSQ